MSGGKKKSCFQITSVTSEFEQKNGTGELTRNDNLLPESNGPTMLLTPKLESTGPLNCYAGGPASRSASPCPVATATPDPSIATNATGSPQNRGAPLRTDRDGAGNSGQAEDSAAAAGPKTKNNEKPTAGGYNGSVAPSLLCPRFAGKTLPCFSAPNTPTQARRGQPALPTAASEAAAASSPSSPSGTLLTPLALPLTSPTGCRFRLVKLDQGLREPYKRGRWTCVDFYDRDSLRHAHSLESLDGLGLASSAADSKRNHKPLFMTPTPNQHHLVHSQGTTHVLAPNLAAPASKPHPATPSRAPQNITPPRSPKEAASLGLWSPPTCLRSPVSLSLAGELINSTESKNVDQAERGRKSSIRLFSPEFPIIGCRCISLGIAKNIFIVPTESTLQGYDTKLSPAAAADPLSSHKDPKTNEGENIMEEGVVINWLSLPVPRNQEQKLNWDTSHTRSRMRFLKIVKPSGSSVQNTAIMHLTYLEKLFNNATCN
ncbi:UNVERIFIED_CONTAM: hypothetical protein FKN15_073456 [Acipenser sinensis]